MEATRACGFAPGLQSSWLEAAQLLLWRDGACPHLGIQAAVCLRLLLVGQAQAMQPAPWELLLPTGSAQSSTSLPRLKPRAPSLLLSSLHEVWGEGRDKQRPSIHIISLPFTLRPSLFFLLLCILMGADQDRWPELEWERPCLCPAQPWSSAAPLCSAHEWMKAPGLKAGFLLACLLQTPCPGPVLWLPSYFKTLCSCFLLFQQEKAICGWRSQSCGQLVCVCVCV